VDAIHKPRREIGRRLPSSQGEPVVAAADGPALLRQAGRAAGRPARLKSAVTLVAKRRTLSRRMALSHAFLPYAHSAAPLMARLVRIPLDVNTWELHLARGARRGVGSDLRETPHLEMKGAPREQTRNGGAQ
jgi:hypothetical protein